MIIYYNVVRNKILREIIVNKNVDYKLAKYANLIELWYNNDVEFNTK